ncbi:DNA sulfur modification protein DndD [Saccharothrix tamanrassetensis]|uniref:Nuclease SbcCD subunit C n=1 Tax=Saccharothrix tamanrassetensis TaxID=1051531 RepID=A0A841CFW4_9PSEU|nr:AAA family ATPase [Saccharothrix tamanrassetensis]MBB5957422.1 DNA sulfur modification protein DndD [Saccharothrix tamanrassetensis]
MRLHSILLTNFRQFAGVQQFSLRSDSIKPVTLIFGANGAGKTTLLNAFSWVLYGTLSDDVEQQQRLVTDSVWRETAIGDSVDVSAEVVFDHDGHNYRVQRRARVHKNSDQQPPVAPDVQMWTTKADGSSELVGAPQEMIYTILPRGVSRFFFFNGERIENLVKKGAYSEVRQDIKVLLDLEQVERALVHLPKVDRRLTADIRKHGGDKASEIQKSIDDLNDRKGSLREELKVLESDLNALNEERESVMNLLRQNSEVAPIQQQRDTVTKELEEARHSLEAALSERASLIATRGFLAFTEQLADSTKAIADAMYRKGALPAPLKREFVDQLLEAGECICGTPLEMHTEPWGRVTSWRQRAGLQAVETVWQRLSGQIDPMTSDRRTLRDDLGQSMKRIGDHRDRVDRLEEVKSELDGKLRDSRLENVQALESKRIELDTRRSEKERRIGAVGHDLEQIVKDIEQKTRDRKNAEVTDELAAKARARSDLVQNVRRALEEILEIRTRDMRHRLDEELKSVFRSITHKNYVPTLSDGFELTLHTNVDGVQLPVPKSTGENQILSLSFVAAVSKLAREIRKERRAEGQSADDAGTYPIVMDAAFGSLDHNYQEAVSRALAQMAPQLVVLVSKSQGLGKVATELNPYVSHLGVIETHTCLTSTVEEDIELRGYSHPYIRHAATDFALLKEITS